MEVTVNILAEDFKDNSYINMATDGTGCPVFRALWRAGMKTKEAVNKAYEHREVCDADHRASRMFYGREPIQDFSFTIPSEEQTAGV